MKFRLRDYGSASQVATHAEACGDRECLCILWSDALARYMLSPRLPQGERLSVLDLGTGIGVTAIAAALAGHRVAAVDLDRIDLSLAGGGRATLAGRTGVANIRVSGPGAVAGEGLRARQATLANDGPGSIALSADVTAKITATGSGDVTITGKAACSVDNRGTGRIACGGDSY